MKRSEDVILLLGFWQGTDSRWWRIGGHYVTVAGVDSENFKIAFSDPYYDRAEVTGVGRVLPPHPAHPLVPTLHNDAQFVSHDIYSILLQSPSPGGAWGLEGYTIYPEDMANFLEQNVPEEFQQSQGSYNPQLPVYVEVEYAIAVSPKEVVPTPTPTQKPVLTGITSLFWLETPDLIRLMVHVLDPVYLNKIYDLEIYFNEQNPPWQFGHPLQWPTGWFGELILDQSGAPVGIRFYTLEFPLVPCQPQQFLLHFLAAPPPDVILIHVTDKDHNNLGYITSVRQ